MRSISHRRWLGAACVATLVAVAPRAAHAGDDFAVYNTRAAFEAALGGSHVVTPGASGVGFSTIESGWGSISAPTTYAPGQTGNLFGGVESVGYTFNPMFGSDDGYLAMNMPGGTTAFGFDYAFRPTDADTDVRLRGTFCFIICSSADQWESVTGGSGFFGVIAPGSPGYIDLHQVKIGGDATHLQVANLTFAGSVTTTPEPGTVILLGSGIAALAGFGLARRRREGHSA